MQNQKTAPARPLRFRAWHPGKKEMLPVGDLTLNPITGSITQVSIEVLDRHGNTIRYEIWDWEEENQVKVMQSTGLTDHGRDIFEGDILEIETDNPDQFLAVVWDADHCYFAVENPLVPRQPLHLFVWAGSINRVAGNVYENPNLLPSA